MNTTPPHPTSSRTLSRHAAFVAAAAALALAPCIDAQTPSPAAKAPPAAGQSDPGTGNGTRSNLAGTPSGDGAQLYTMKFDGGGIPELCDRLRTSMPGDSLVVSASAQGIELPGFELRNVRLAEIGRTMEFLSEGRLRVEVVEKDNPASGNIWRIGCRNAAEAAIPIKMRSVAAPHLFADEKQLKEVLEAAAEAVDRRRLEAAGVSRAAAGNFRSAGVLPLKSQNVFVIIGDEDGVAGLESLIQATEQRLANAKAEKVEELLRGAPKMKAVAAPHLFANEPRLKRFINEVNVMSGELAEINDYRWTTAGFPAKSTPYWVNVHPREEQKVFMLLGNGDAITGMESLIKAAEQLAEKDDAKVDAAIEAERQKEAARKEAEVQAAKDRAKADKREP